MAIFHTYDAIGNRECLLDIITNITPTETPMANRFGKVQIDGIKPEWQTDTLRSAADNAQVQGYLYSAVLGTVAATTRVYNYTQIMACGYSIAKTQDIVAKAGRASEVAYQKAKAMKEFALDLEYMLAKSTSRTAPAGPATAGHSYGVKGWISTNLTDAAAATLTETILLNALQAAWTVGATEMNALYCGAFQKRKINSFVATERRMMEGETVRKDLIAVYESDFGTFDLILDRRVDTDYVYCLDDNKFKVGVLRPTVSIAVPETGSKDDFVIEGEVSCISYNEAASAAIYNLATT